MKRVLSLLLVIPFLTVQAWALRGGPFDSLEMRGIQAVAGTYGISLAGTSSGNSTSQAGLDANGNPVFNAEDRSGTTGVMVLTVAAKGFTSGKALMFDQGKMYAGTASGIGNSGNTKFKVLMQLSHYTNLSSVIVNAGTSGSSTISSSAAAYVDETLSGELHFDLSLDYFSGLIVASGGGKLYLYDMLLDPVKLLANGMVQISVGTQTVTIINPQYIRQTPSNMNTPFLNLTASGVRQTTEEVSPSGFSVPSDSTLWQWSGGDISSGGSSSSSATKK